MKRTISFICGFLAGSLLFGGGAVCAAGIYAELSSQRIIVDGKAAEMEAYLIDGHNYLQLRDVGEAVGFNVYWDDKTRTVHIDSSQPYTGMAPATKAESGIDSRVITGALTEEACSALRRAIETGTQSDPAVMSEETKAAMQEAAAAVGCWPVYDLVSEGSGRYSFRARYPEPFEEAAEHCRPFIGSLAGLTEREKVRQIAFYVCDRLVYSATATSSPRTVLSDDEEHKGNCTSYSHCFKFLCDLARIPCIFCHSDDHQWNLVYVEGQWWHVNVSGADVSDPSLRPKLPVLKTEEELQGSTFTQSQPWLTELAKELVVPGSGK